MRILHFVHTPRHSGAEALVKNICKAHQADGHSCGIASIAPPQMDYRAEVQELNDLGVELFFTSIPVAKLSRIRHYRQAVLDFKPDVVFAHSVLPALYGRWSTGFGKSRVPFVSVLHSASGVDFSEVDTGIAERLTRYRVDGVVAVSEETAAAYSRRFGLGPPVAAIKNGIDVAAFSGIDRSQARAKLNLTDQQKLVLQIGRIYSVKRQAFSLSLLKNDLQAGDIDLWFVGPVEDAAYETALRDTIKILGVDLSVRILGGRNDIPELLAAADLYVMPSIHESQGIALIEALASGIPVVASDIPAFRFASDMASVRLCGVEDAGLWQRAVAELLEAPRVSRPIKEFSIKETAKRYLDFAATVRGFS